jgi:nicotinamidase-related amidase
LYGSLEGVYQTNKDSKDVHWMDKTRYSSFTGTDLELQLRTRGIQELHLCGVATNICILHTAIDAYYKGFDIFVYQDAVASFDADGHVWALKHFKILLEQQLYNVHH